jgi:hypothetical protein
LSAIDLYGNSPTRAHRAAPVTRYVAPVDPHAHCAYVGRCVPRMLDSSADKCEQP